MCDCLTWDSAVFRAAAKLARARPDTVFAVFCALEADGERAARLRPEILAAGLGRRAPVIERILASLLSLGVTCDGVVTAEWRREPLAGSARGLSMRPSAIRMRRKRSRDGGGGDPPAVGREGSGAPVSAPVTSVTSDGPSPSLSFFPEELSEQAREQKPMRAPAPDMTEDGFAELRALWPLSNRMHEAAAEYRRYRQRHSASEIIEAATGYFAGKEGWRSAMYLVNWLRTDPCRDPVLPLAAAPREVAASERAPPPVRIDWDALGEAWLATRQWPAEVGAPPGSDECRMPFGLMQRMRRRAIQQRMTG